MASTWSLLYSQFELWISILGFPLCNTSGHIRYTDEWNCTGRKGNRYAAGSRDTPSPLRRCPAQGTLWGIGNELHSFTGM